MPRNLRSIACAISGGVDSAVAALLLKRRGYNVTGVFMKNWDEANETGTCSSDRDRDDAQYVCCHLCLPFLEVNFVKEYWTEVFSQMLQGYQDGTTPNPDVLCNRHIKFGAFFKYATQELGADAVATGHYARNSCGETLQHLSDDTGAKLLRPLDQTKDQTLFLSQMSQSALRRTVFPVGELMKSDVKNIALNSGMERIVKKKESMGICFIGSRNFNAFIEEYIEPKPGCFRDIETGEIVGEHKGTHYWTIGQRCHIGGLSKAYFVAEVNPSSREVRVVPGTQHPALYTPTVYTHPPHWIHSPPAALADTGAMECQFRFQHTHRLLRCVVEELPTHGLRVNLSGPLRAITAGQYAVFYSGEECLGSAVIHRPGPSLFEMKKVKHYQAGIS